jgi:hypothetical protein
MIKLTVSSNYVKKWTVNDALRELFQNALDHGNWDYLYIPHTKTLTITSKNCFLKKRTLLLGESDKNESDIGQFGEGYKLALLILLRMGCSIRIYNGAKEVWQPVMCYHRDFESNVLGIKIRKRRLSRNPNNVVFEIKNIDEETFEKYSLLNLHINTPSAKIETPSGLILTEKEYRGQIFVNGLYVATLKNLYYGYSIKPKFLKIGRDRNLLPDFELLWVTGRMWATQQGTEEFRNVIISDVSDATYVQHHLGRIDDKFEDYYDDFKSMFGKIAIPVDSQTEAEYFKRHGGKPIIVPTHYKAYLNCSSQLQSFKNKLISDEKDTPYQLLKKFFDKYEGYMSDNAVEDFKSILKEAEEW